MSGALKSQHGAYYNHNSVLFQNYLKFPKIYYFLLFVNEGNSPNDVYLDTFQTCSHLFLLLIFTDSDDRKAFLQARKSVMNLWFFKVPMIDFVLDYLF